MGIPPNGGPGADCLACFAAGKTPLEVYLNLAGIGRGGLWVPGWPDPPNGNWKLTQFAPCGWFIVKGVFTANFGCANPGTGIDMSITGIQPCFTFASPNDCVFGGGNQLGPFHLVFYFGGVAQISWSV